jgi:23S rRNA pseudouridine955/2504/2580 synthase
LRQGRVIVNGKAAKAHDIPDYGAKITIPGIKNTTKTPIIHNNLPFPSVIWEGNGLLAVNKPSGLDVHGQNSLDSMVRSYLADKLPESLSFTPGPLHRLDKPSSGIVVFSTSLEGARLFSSLMHDRKVQKTYIAIVEGIVNIEETWQDELIRDTGRKKTLVLPKKENPQNSKTAITKVTPLVTMDNRSLIQLEILTGRTHQIRAQSAFHGHPLIGDVKYGGKNNNKQSKSIANIFLHAWKLEFLDIFIEAPLPEAFKTKIEQLNLLKLPQN